MDEDFMKGLVVAAHEYGLELKRTSKLDDGFTEVVFVDEDQDDAEWAVDMRVMEEKLRDRVMIELRIWDERTHSFHTCFVSAIPVVVFGVIYTW